MISPSRPPPPGLSCGSAISAIAHPLPAGLSSETCFPASGRHHGAGFEGHQPNMGWWRWSMGWWRWVWGGSGSWGGGRYSAAGCGAGMSSLWSRTDAAFNSLIIIPPSKPPSHSPASLLLPHRTDGETEIRRRKVANQEKIIQTQQFRTAWQRESNPMEPRKEQRCGSPPHRHAHPGEAVQVTAEGLSFPEQHKLLSCGVYSSLQPAPQVRRTGTAGIRVRSRHRPLH